MLERAEEAKDVRESGGGERAVRANEAKHVRESRDVRNLNKMSKCQVG